MVYSIGGVGLLIECYAYTLHDGHRFRRWSGGSALIWALMYLGLDAITAALTMGSTALRSWMSGPAKEGRHKGILCGIYLGIFAILSGVSWQGVVSLLPAFAVMNTTIALFYLGNSAMRMALLASSGAWIWNDLYWGAWPALIAESLAAGINIWTLIQLNKNETKNPN